MGEPPDHEKDQNVEDVVEDMQPPASNNDASSPPRLLIVSSRAKQIPVMTRALRPNVIMVQYRYENSTLDGILGLVAQALGATKVESIGLVFHASGTHIFLCAAGERMITTQSIIEQVSIREFFITLIENHLDLAWINARIDFLSCTAADTLEGGIIASAIEALVPQSEMPVGMSVDLIGTGVPLCRIGVEEDVDKSVGALYFNLDLLTGGGRIRSKLLQNTAGYEKIRVVGKGAFGAAVLYRRKEDDSLVILKEINMHDLSSQERQLALNEAAVLSKLEHPNIITYYDSFEEDGILMIEMEYAEAGNLSQFLAKREKQVEEKEILVMFHQMVSAVRYLHEQNVLHRDLKTANIFLTKENGIKVGDFGISKVMGTETKHKGATTVLGTPYYISPEMCEGKPYNDKSDIWALGCILYEMVCLQKTFEGSNLPALVNKIMKGQYDQVRGNYSSEIKGLIGDLLRKEPEMRPSAYQLLHQRLPDMLSRYEGSRTRELVKEDDENWSSTDSGHNGKQQRRIRSVVYAFNTAIHALQAINGLQHRMKIKQLSIGATHKMLVTTEKLVYAWGDNSSGQLGTGDKESRPKPCLIESLTGKCIAKLGAGSGFSVFCSDNGIVMTCGRGDMVGQGKLEGDLVRPRLIDDLLSIDIVSISCGAEHVVVVGEGGKVFAWGVGTDGRLGTGLEQNEVSPVEIRIPGPLRPRLVRCGLDGTMLVTEAGSLLAMGSNQHNKLNLNKRQGLFTQMKLAKIEVDKSLSPTPVKNFGSRVVDVSLGTNHSAILLESGHVYMCGRNEKAELGRGNRLPAAGPILLKALADKACVMIQCGEDFTLAATSDNSLYFWGQKGIAQEHAPSEEFKTTLIGTHTKNEAIEKQLESSYPGRSVAVIEPFRQIPDDSITYDPLSIPEDGEKSSGAVPSEAMNESLSVTRTSQFWRFLKTKPPDTEGDPTVASLPLHVLRLDSSGSASVNQSISLGSIVCYRTETYVVVETTAPLPRKQNRRSNAKTKGTLFQKVKHGESTLFPLGVGGGGLRSGGGEGLDPANAADETKMATWIRREMDEAEVLHAPPSPVHNPTHTHKGAHSSLRGPHPQQAGPELTQLGPKNSKAHHGEWSSSEEEHNKQQHRLSQRRQKTHQKSRGRISAEEWRRLIAEKETAERALTELHDEHRQLDENRQESQRQQEALQKEIEALRHQLAARETQQEDVLRAQTGSHEPRTSRKGGSAGEGRREGERGRDGAAVIPPSPTQNPNPGNISGEGPVNPPSQTKESSRTKSKLCAIL